MKPGIITSQNESTPLKYSPNDPKDRLVTRAIQMASCDGSEDLKFYLGVSNAETEKGKAQYDNPTAFAYRTQYTPSAGWGKGYVWLAPHGAVEVYNNGGSGWFPDWTYPNALRAMILHEIGHILGCEHMRGTIMAAGINSLIKENSFPLERLHEQRTRIDHDLEMIRVSVHDGVI